MGLLPGGFISCYDVTGGEILNLTLCRRHALTQADHMTWHFLSASFCPVTSDPRPLCAGHSDLISHVLGNICQRVIADALTLAIFTR